MATGDFFWNTKTDSRYEWTPELENHAKGRKEFVLIDAHGEPVRTEQKLKSYRELEQLREEYERKLSEEVTTVTTDESEPPAPVPPARRSRKKKE